MTEQNVIVEAFGDLAPNYEDVVDKELKRFWGWSYAGFVTQLLESVPSQNGDAILDVATGTALIPRRLASRDGFQGRVVGLDITLPMLKQGQAYIQANGKEMPISLTCASATTMPFPAESFDIVVCGLATHHIEELQLLSEMWRVLKKGGTLTIADVAAAPQWRFPGVKSLLRVGAFLYFLSTEGAARAWAESDAVSHVHTAEEWHMLLDQQGFREIKVNKLRSHRRWSPAPLILKAAKA
jgi:ubiquinone/menaquinone biosynthesis C-methylase UbiE